MKNNALMQIVYRESDYQCRYAGDESPNEIEVVITRWYKGYPNAQELTTLTRKVAFDNRYLLDDQGLMSNSANDAQLQRFGIQQFDRLKADFPHVLAEVSEE